MTILSIGHVLFETEHKTRYLRIKHRNCLDYLAEFTTNSYNLRVLRIYWFLIWLDYLASIPDSVFEGENKRKLDYSAKTRKYLKFFRGTLGKIQSVTFQKSLFFLLTATRDQEFFGRKKARKYCWRNVCYPVKWDGAGSVCNTMRPRPGISFLAPIHHPCLPVTRVVAFGPFAIFLPPFKY